MPVTPIGGCVNRVVSGTYSARYHQADPGDHRAAKQTLRQPNLPLPIQSHRKPFWSAARSLGIALSPPGVWLEQVSLPKNEVLPTWLGNTRRPTRTGARIAMQTLLYKL
jgi:hypothetical protein